MSTIFPGSASVGQIFEGYSFDGTAWNIIGIDLTADYLEESSASATYLTQVNASTTYLTQTSASSTYAPLSGALFTGDVTATKLAATSPGGDEGGEINLEKAATNTTLNTGVVIDVNQDRLRIFEQGGNNRGVYVDLANTSNGVGTSITPGVGGVPYRMAAGTATTDGSGLVTVTFPTNRFTQTPLITATVNSSPNNSGIVMSYNQSTTGATFYCPLANTSLSYIAIQMTSSSGSG